MMSMPSNTLYQSHVDACLGSTSSANCYIEYVHTHPQRQRSGLHGGRRVDPRAKGFSDQPLLIPYMPDKGSANGALFRLCLSASKPDMRQPDVLSSVA